MAPESPRMLEVEGLRLERADGAPVLEDITFGLGSGQILAVVGESGSGKSQLLLSLLGLAMPGSRLTGSARFKGEQLIGAGENALRRLRGNRIAMLFQDPMTALNPYLTIRRQLVEVLQAHRGASMAEATGLALTAMKEVELPDPELHLRQYPHELSGGMRQRVMIAMAILTEPDLLLADEPTTALDVTTQARVLDLLLRLREQRGMSMLFVTHDLGVVAKLGGEAMVLQRGRVVERGETRRLLTQPASEYTASLLAAVRKLERPGA
jgi:ABC-type glutathione transport system ATPase component